jgi:pyruvate dehydrogenase E2 component (dihydrolipoamide acetyltransferase)
MAKKLLMIALSPTMETGTIVRWSIAENSAFSEGDVLCEVETDKATMEYEATDSGVLRKIVAPAKSKIRVGDTIAVFGTADEDISSMLSEPTTAPVATPPSEAFTVPPSAEVEELHPPAENTPSTGEHLPDGVKASPLARSLARQHAVDIKTIAGSGPGGRIVKADVEQAIARSSRPQTADSAALSRDVVIPVSDKRRIIASRLSGSKHDSPHFYLSVQVVADALLAARADINRQAEERLSLNAFLVRLTAEALRRHPEVNSSWQGETILRHGNVDVALAVAQEDGLVTPVVRDADRKGIAVIDAELRDLIKRARDNKLAPEEYAASTFTISNLGSFGVRQFAAIINPPNAAILSVGEIFREPYEAADRGVAFCSAMILTLSCDHRLVDGAQAARFADDLRRMIEQPMAALV